MANPAEPTYNDSSPGMRSHLMASPKRRLSTQSRNLQQELEKFADVQVLDFSHRRLNDGDIEQLACARNLRVLNLSGNNITDSGLLHLKDVESLMMLFVTGTRVTEHGRAELQKHLPACGIIV